MKQQMRFGSELRDGGPILGTGCRPCAYSGAATSERVGGLCDGVQAAIQTC